MHGQKYLDFVTDSEHDDAGRLADGVLCALGTR